VALELALGGKRKRGAVWPAARAFCCAPVRWRSRSAPAPTGWPLRSLAVIAAPYTDPSARQLAIRLLDKGSADQVLVGVDWEEHPRRVARNPVPS
jgi:hypothetical protein